MKKLLIINLILITFIIVGLIAYHFLSNSGMFFDISRLKPINVNGTDYLTTGAIPSEDQSSQKSLDETVRLGLMGTVTTGNYSVTAAGQGNITVTLNTPYDQSKQVFLNWLKLNGFGDIPVSSITFQENK